MEATTSPKNLTLAIFRTMAEAIRESGKAGMPSGTMYAVLMAYGVTLEQYNRLIGTLVEAGVVKNRGHLLTWVEGATLTTIEMTLPRPRARPSGAGRKSGPVPRGPLARTCSAWAIRPPDHSG